jgi:hypothetical protein
MAMTWTSLSAAKGVSGSIANFVSYTKLDIPPIIDEAQALIYGLIRVREMMADYKFSLAQNYANVPLPTGFLDPIGKIRLTSINSRASHKDSGFLQAARSYQELSGALGTNPFTTASGSNTVSVALAGNGFTQDSVFNTSGATAANGVTINGTFPISGITDANNFTIDITSLGTTPSGSGAGGGTAVIYLIDQLVTGIPAWWGIWNETIYFDVALVQQTLAILQYYRSLPLLSASNQSNFLTNRYPHLMRTACQTAAADFMKDSTEYQKGYTRLTTLVQAINIENDGQLRGMELDPEIP